VFIVNQKPKAENLVEGPDGKMMTKKALKKLEKKLEKERRKEESMNFYLRFINLIKNLKKHS